VAPQPVQSLGIGSSVRATEETYSNHSNALLRDLLWPATIACDNDDDRTFDVIFENGEERNEVKEGELYPPFTEESLGKSNTNKNN